MKKTETEKPKILLTNDDGFFSEGLEVLAQALKTIAEITIVAPDREKSATSLALSLHRPLRIKEVRKNVFAIDGTPADCVYMAVQKLLPHKPDLLISGPNPGPNLGQQDTAYSGTVAGAIQGTFLQIPSIALSFLHDAEGNFHYDHAIKISLFLIKKILKDPPNKGITLNINIPPLRERREDIELLFMHFLRLKDYSGNIANEGIPEVLMEVLINYSWPGNIRELENVVERFVALSAGGKIGVNLLPDHIKNLKKSQLVSDAPNIPPSMDEIEKAYIYWVLTQHGGQKQKAAEVLGIGRSTLDRKIEKYGLN